MSEMVERVARALAVYQFGSSVSWEDQAPMARAAIEAMREPTKVMLGNSAGVARLWLEADWQAMIDAALGKKP